MASDATSFNVNVGSRPGLEAHRAFDTLERTLDAAFGSMLRAERVQPAFERLVTSLEVLRLHVSPDFWLDQLASRCRKHPLAEITTQDPYTRRALHKPRGFAGDARMLDFIYDGVPPEGTSAIGAALFRATTQCPSGLSVRERRDRLAGLIHHTVSTRPDAQVISLACGHLRELEQLELREIERIGRVVAIDQDRKALARVDGQLGLPNVETVRGSVRDIIAGRLGYEGADLVYAAGLFDYLSDGVSVRLLERLLNFLRPGGRLVVGNFTPTNWGRSYMDSFMEWSLTYRTPGEMRELGRRAAADHKIAIEHVTTDELGNIAYLELVTVA